MRNYLITWLDATNARRPKVWVEEIAAESIEHAWRLARGSRAARQAVAEEKRRGRARIVVADVDRA